MVSIFRRKVVTVTGFSIYSAGYYYQSYILINLKSNLFHPLAKNDFIICPRINERHPGWYTI